MGTIFADKLLVKNGVLDHLLVGHLAVKTGPAKTFFENACVGQQLEPKAKNVVQGKLIAEVVGVPLRQNLPMFWIVGAFSHNRAG